MKLDKKAVELWYECQQSLVRVQSRFGHDQELLEEGKDAVYKKYYNSIDLENQNREKRQFLEEILRIKEDIWQNQKASTDCRDNWEQLERWRILFHDINRKIKECEVLLENVMSADNIVQYENGLKTLNLLKDDVQSNIDNFVLIENKLTKELAIEHRQEIENRHILDDENGYQEADLYSWFIVSFKNGCYEHDEAIEIANIITD